MKKNIFIMIGFVLVLLLSACGAAPEAESSTDNGSTSEEVTTTESSEAGDEADENALAESTELIMGTILLQNSEQAVDATQAGTLNSGDKGHLECMHQFEGAVEGGNHLVHHIRFVIAHFHTGRPTSALAADHHALEGVVMQEPLQGGVEFMDHIDVEHVVLGAVECDSGDPVGFLQLDGLVY